MPILEYDEKDYFGEFVPEIIELIHAFLGTQSAFIEHRLCQTWAMGIRNAWDRVPDSLPGAPGW